MPVLLRASVRGRVVRRRLLLGDEPATVDLGGPVEWVVVNDGGWGFFRVTYDRDLMQRLGRHRRVLDPLERLTLVTDTWATVVAGLAPVRRFVELARLHRTERHPAVWSALLPPLDDLDRMLPDPERPALQAFVRELVGPVIEELGWDPVPGEGERVRKLRAEAIQTSGRLGADDGAREQARRVHAAYLRGRAVDADVAAAALSVVAATGGDADFEAVLERARLAENPQEEIRCLLALADFEHEHLVRRTMDLARTQVRSGDGPRLVSRLLANRRFGHLAWTMVKEHWAALTARFPESLHDRMVEGVAFLADPRLAADVREFLDGHPLPVRQRIVDQLLERLDIAVAFRQRESAGLVRVLSEAGG